MYRSSQELTALLEPVVTGLGYELWGVELLTPASGLTLRVYIDKAGDDGIDVDDCQRVSHQVAGVLDVEDPIKGHYMLEVSSPGLDRLLFTGPQFQRYLGETIKVRMHGKVEGRRRFQGTLVSVDSSSIVIEDDQQRYRLPLADIERARLVADFQ